MDEKPITTKDLELELLKHREAERVASDGKYAPMIIKTVVYGLLVAFAGGVVLGMGDLVSKAFIGNIEQKAQSEAQAAAAAGAAANLYDSPR